MLLDPVAADAFISGYRQVLLHVASDEEAGRPSDNGTLDFLVHARNRARRNPARLEQAIESAASAGLLNDTVASAIRTLQVDNWVYLRDSKSYSVFIQHSAEFALGVQALTQRIRDIVGTSGVMIEAGVVRYCGRFVCDGLVSRMVHLGPQYRRSFSEAFRTLRAGGRFHVTSGA